MANLMNVFDKKRNIGATANIKEDGSAEVFYLDGEQKTVAPSTFKRWFRVEGEVQEMPKAEQQELLQVVPEGEVKDDLEALLSDAEEIDDTPSEEQEEQQQEEEEQQQGQEEQEQKEEVSNDEPKGDSNVPAPVDTPQENNKPEPTPEPQFKMGYREGHIGGTRGGKCEKFVATVDFNGLVLEVTEYNGYITDVKVFKPTEDDDLELIYRSPKMSLKDTFEYLGLGPDEMKLARKEVTAIRKQVKEEWKAQQEQAAASQED